MIFKIHNINVNYTMRFNLTNFLRNGSSVVDGAKGSNSNASYMKDSSFCILKLDSLINMEVCHFVLLKPLRDNLLTLIAATFFVFLSVVIMYMKIDIIENTEYFLEKKKKRERKETYL